jgi:hypothetical protein
MAVSNKRKLQANIQKLAMAVVSARKARPNEEKFTFVRLKKHGAPDGRTCKPIIKNHRLALWLAMESERTKQKLPSSDVLRSMRQEGVAVNDAEKQVRDEECPPMFLVLVEVQYADPVLEYRTFKTSEGLVSYLLDLDSGWEKLKLISVLEPRPLSAALKEDLCKVLGRKELPYT